MSDTGRTGISRFSRCGGFSHKDFAVCLNHEAAFLQGRARKARETGPASILTFTNASIVRSGKYNIRNPETLCQH